MGIVEHHELYRRGRDGLAHTIRIWRLEPIRARIEPVTAGNRPKLSLQMTMVAAVSEFGAAAKAKPSAKAITGAREDQLRGPLETFIQHMGVLAGHKPGSLVAVSETTLSGQGTRPDYAISVGNALTGFIEVKAPGKGAAPRTFTTDRYEFADGYAQAVTLGLLMARAQSIQLTNGLEAIVKALGQATTVIGSAFRVSTDHVETHAVLKTSLDTLTRVLGVVDWAEVSAGKTEAWLYFYEHVLAVYDNALRRRTGSYYYYTRPNVVTAMVRLVNDMLRDPERFGVASGLVHSCSRLIGGPRPSLETISWSKWNGFTMTTAR